MKFRPILCVAAAAVAITACKNGPQQTEEINDSTTPLHLLKPDYKVPYGELTADAVKADLERIFSYIDAELTPDIQDKDDNIGQVIITEEYIDKKGGPRILVRSSGMISDKAAAQ